MGLLSRHQLARARFDDPLEGPCSFELIMYGVSSKNDMWDEPAALDILGFMSQFRSVNLMYLRMHA